MKTKNIAKFLIIIIITLSVTVAIESTEAEQQILSIGEDNVNWLHFGYDSTYTSYNPAENTVNTTNIVQLERKWGIGCDDAFFSDISRSPAIYNGTLYSRFYTGPAISKLHAFNAQTGQLLWRFTENNTGWAPQPVVSNDGIIFDMEGSYPTHLYAIDGETGEELWEAPIAFELGFSDTALVTVDEVNGLIYLIEAKLNQENGKIFALDKQTGEIVWYKSKATDNVSFKGEFIHLNEGRIFIIAEIKQGWRTNIRMACINVSSQEIEFIFDKPESIEHRDISEYSLCNDKLIVTYCDNADSLESTNPLVVYDSTSQDVLWQENHFLAVTGKIACNTTRDIIYVPTDPYLYALNVSTGDEIWRYMGYGEIFNPSIANGIVYFLSDTNMYAVDEDTGELVFSYPLGYEAGDTTQVAICDGMVYFSGNGGTCDLYALSLANQTPIAVY